MDSFFCFAVIVLILNVKRVLKIIIFPIFFFLWRPSSSDTLREEHEEGKHQGEQTNGLRQGEAENGVVEQHLRQVRLAGAGDQQGTEDRTNTHTHASQRDGGEAGADVVQALDGDGHGGGLAGAHDQCAGGGGRAAGGGLSEDTAHHFLFFFFRLVIRSRGSGPGSKGAPVEVRASQKKKKR